MSEKISNNDKYNSSRDSSPRRGLDKKSKDLRSRSYSNGSERNSRHTNNGTSKNDLKRGDIENRKGSRDGSSSRANSVELKDSFRSRNDLANRKSRSFDRSNSRDDSKHENRKRQRSFSRHSKTPPRSYRPNPESRQYSRRYHASRSPSINRRSKKFIAPIYKTNYERVQNNLNKKLPFTYHPISASSKKYNNHTSGYHKNTAGHDASIPVSKQIQTPIPQQGPLVNRDKMSPFLLRVFHKVNGEHTLSNFKIRGSEPVEDEIQIYTWKDAKLRELVNLIKDVCEEARDKEAIWTFKLIYPDRSGNNVMEEIGTVHSLKPNPAQDNKTLQAARFQIGDFICLSISAPSRLNDHVEDPSNILGKDKYFTNKNDDNSNSQAAYRSRSVSPSGN